MLPVHLITFILVSSHFSVCDAEEVKVSSLVKMNGSTSVYEHFQNASISCTVEMATILDVEKLVILKDNVIIITLTGEKIRIQRNTSIINAEGNTSTPELIFNIPRPPLSATGYYQCRADVYTKDNIFNTLLSELHYLLIRGKVNTKIIQEEIRKTNDLIRVYKDEAIKELKAKMLSLEKTHTTTKTDFLEGKIQVDSGSFWCGSCFKNYPKTFSNRDTYPDVLIQMTLSFPNIRAEDTEVKFKVRFLKTPKVILEKKSQEIESDYNIRYDFETYDITKTGFTGRCATWSNSVNHFFELRWIAIGA